MQDLKLQWNLNLNAHLVSQEKHQNFMEMKEERRNYQMRTPLLHVLNLGTLQATKKDQMVGHLELATQKLEKQKMERCVHENVHVQKYISRLFRDLSSGNHGDLDYIPRKYTEENENQIYFYKDEYMGKLSSQKLEKTIIRRLIKENLERRLIMKD